jgi:hypothetical protein
MNRSHAVSLTLALFFGLCAVGCSSAPADSSSTCPVGSEGCACTTGGACDNGLLCASNFCVNAGSATSTTSTGTGTATDCPSNGDAGSAQPLPEAGPIDARPLDAMTPPAVLLGTWRGGRGGWPREVILRVDWTCGEVGSSCSYSVTHSTDVPTANTPWLVQERHECCINTLTDSGAFSTVVEIAAIDAKTMTTVERDGTSVTYVALTRE